VFVHAENDTTMPWVETEELFKSTLKAAMEAASPHDGIPKNLKVIDLGEAGRQEVWQSGTKCIQKTIAKHGGKRIPIQNSGSRMRSLRPSTLLYANRQPCSESSLLHDNDWLLGGRLNAGTSICGAFEVTHDCSNTVSTTRGARLEPCLIHAVIALMPRFPAH
jgi:hypothetical protein